MSDQERQVVSVRAADAGDLVDVERLGHRLVPPTYVDAGLLPADEVDQLLDGFWSVDYLITVLDGDGHLLVAEVDDRIVGMCEVAYLKPGEAVMWKLYVDDALRGRGIGSRLVSLARRALKPDTRRFYTEYVTGNDGAAAFYRSQGFRLDRVEQDEREDVDATYTWVVVELGDGSSLEDRVQLAVDTA